MSPSIMFLIRRRRQQTLKMVLYVLVADLGNGVEEKRDHKTIGMFVGVFWQTEDMNGGELFLKYREKAGEETMSILDVVLGRRRREKHSSFLYSVWCGYFGEEEETENPCPSVWMFLVTP